jgi:outer membrane protein TolC
MKRRIWKKTVARAMGATISMLLFAITAAAQFGTPAPPTTLPTQLPLSGRSGQGGGVAAEETPVPSTTTSVNAINPTISVSGAYGESTNSTKQMPFNGRLSLAEAIRRGTAYNLGAVGMTQALGQVRGQAKSVRSELMPHISADIDDTEETINLRSFGFNFSVPGFMLPSTVGPFNVMNLRGRVSQDVVDFTALNNYRSARDSVRASVLSSKDAEDLVVMAVAGTYLQVIAAAARVNAAQTDLTTVTTLYQQDIQRLKFGKIAEVDVNRSRVATLLDQERLITLQNHLSKQKIALARLVGIPPNDQYAISDNIAFTPAPPMTVDDAVKQAIDNRSDLKAAEAQVDAAKRALAAARAERYPSGSVNADYGEIGDPSQLRPTFTVAATLNIPIWNGGKTSGDIQQAQAVLDQRRAELEDTKGQIESDVRSAFLDVEAAANQVDVAQQNLDVNHETLGQTQIKFESGVSTNVDVVQSQQSVSGAQLDYIDAVFAHNVAKLSLARAMGDAMANISQFLKIQ